MKKIYLIPLCMCLLFNSNIFADGKTRGEFPLQVQLLSGNVGAGPSIGYNLNDTIYIGGDILSRSDTASESTAAATGTFSTNLISARFSTWDDSGFYLQVGAGNVDWSVKATDYEYIGNWPNGTSSSDATVKIKWSGPASMIGLGWNWIGDSGFSGGLGFQSIGVGEPEINVTDNEGQATATQIAEEKENYNSLYSSYQSALNIYTNIGWNF